MSLALYQDNLVHDAWHNVQSPGGYEWWYFDAEDPATDTQVVAILLEGFIWHPELIRRYEKFARSPTKHAPPFPSEYPCAYLCVYRGGKILHQFMTQYKPQEFAAGRDEVSVAMGPNRLSKDEQGRLRLSLTGTPWSLTGRGPITHAGQTLSAELCFTPKFSHAPIQRRFLSKSMTAADHQWVLANPLCGVSGAISLRTPELNQTIEFNGLGYHDHNFGTAPLGPGLHRWIWGRVLFDEQVYSFHYALPKDSRLPHEPHLIHGNMQQLREMPMQKVTAEWTCRSRLMLKYPKRIGFDDALVMTNPKVIDDTPFYLRLVYDAVALGKRSKAFCEVAYPHRLRWPLLGRMVEMSIDKR
jgi:carotenoid 1,2-hydratase